MFSATSSFAYNKGLQCPFFQKKVAYLIFYANLLKISEMKEKQDLCGKGFPAGAPANIRQNSKSKFIWFLELDC